MNQDDLSLHDREVLSLLQRATPEERRALAKLMADNTPAPVDENEQDPLKLLKGLHKKGDGDYGQILRDAARQLKVNCMDAGEHASRRQLLPAADIESRITAALLEKLEKEKPDEYRALMEDVRKMAQEQGCSIAFEEAVKTAAVAAGSITTRVVAEFLLTRLAISTLAGAVGWALVAAVSAFQLYRALSGPAYTVTIPAIVHIAVLRQRITTPAPRPAAPLADI